MKIFERAALGSEGARAGSFADIQLILNDLPAREHVVARPGDLAPDVDPHSPVADRGDEDLRAFDVSLELLGEEAVLSTAKCNNTVRGTAVQRCRNIMRNNQNLKRHMLLADI